MANAGLAASIAVNSRSASARFFPSPPRLLEMERDQNSLLLLARMRISSGLEDAAIARSSLSQTAEPHRESAAKFIARYPS